MNECGNYYDIVEKYHPDLLHCKWTLYRLSHQESPLEPYLVLLNVIKERKASMDSNSSHKSALWHSSLFLKTPGMDI